MPVGVGLVSRRYIGSGRKMARPKVELVQHTAEPLYLFFLARDSRRRAGGTGSPVA